MNIIKLLIKGMLAALGALLLELIFSTLYFIIFQKDPSAGLSAKITWLLIASIAAEEIFKFIFIHQESLKTNNRLEIIRASLLIGSGFGLLELFFFAINNTSSELISLGILGAFLLHLLTAGIMGGLFANRTQKHPISGIIFPLFIAFTLHFFYNLLVIENMPYKIIYFYLLLPLVLIVSLYLRAKKLQSLSIAKL